MLYRARCANTSLDNYRKTNPLELMELSISAGEIQLYSLYITELLINVIVNYSY